MLRDPGTTSSWKSTRSVAAAPAPAPAWKEKDNEKEKEKRVFLYNWKNYKSWNEEEEEEEGAGGSSSLLEDSLSDALNGCDSKSDAGTRPSIFPRRTLPIKKKCKKTNNNPRFDFLSHRQTNLGTASSRKLAPSNSKALLLERRHHSLARDDSDDTEGYCNSVSGASPLLLRLRHKLPPRRKTSRRDDSSYSYSTPALSTSSYNRYGGGRHYPSTVGSWDGTTTSINDIDDIDDDDDHLDLPGRQGCGIPCYWSKRKGSCCSPSLSDTLRRKGSSMFCGSQSIYPRHRRSSSASHKRRISLRSAQGVLPLLTNSGDVREGSSMGTGRSYDDDELSTNFGELDLEGLSRLDGRRWSSSCRSRSQEGLEIVALNGEGEDDGTPENSRSFSHKYKPLFFGELIGQNIVVQSLINAVSRGRIAPVYLFQGPRGTGKTSTARIFAAALNCVAASDESKPCGYCGECADFISGKSSDLVEVDGTNKNGIDKARYLLKRLSVRSSSAYSRYTVFVIDECHLLPSKTWLGFLKFLEEPPQRVVFIFITSDLDNVPRTIQSRCQKYLFNKIKDGDIVTRLRKISTEENLDVETDALDLIAVNADGSLRDAETMLEQLSLLGKRITTSLVNELVSLW